MKKRILALALAGTTAFSVFSMAVSALGDTTHVDFENDAYEPYEIADVTEISNGSLKTFDNATISDAELSRVGETIDPETVYAYDYFGNAYDVINFMEAYEAVTWKRFNNKNAGYFYLGTGETDALKAIMNGQALSANIVTAAYYTYNDARVNVLDEYVEFLGDLGLIEYTHRNTIKATAKTGQDILDSYVYKYVDKNKKEVDVYNFEGLVADLMDTVDDIEAGYNGTANGLVAYSSSELVYIMQQYDKYTSGFYMYESTDPLTEYRWADLLISALEAVDGDDFTTAGAYNAFARKATKAISDYENAVTGTAQRGAIKGLYEAVTYQVGRSAGADKEELVATLNDLYFNNKTIPSVYMPIAENNSKVSDLYLYGYEVVQDVIDASVVPNVSAAQAVYPIYPVWDYYLPATAGGTAKAYVGNESKGAPEMTVNAEYEWFWNVYALATTVNSMNKAGAYQGIIDTVNAALEEAVAELAITKAPAGSTALRLDEAVEKYEGAIESDYVAKYYNAYTKANEIAADAEGDLATKYAIEMVIISGETLGYQSAQTTITKGEIRDLGTEVTVATKALAAIKADKDKYNAAQILALREAIDSANALIAVYNGTTTTTVNTKPANYTGDKDSILKSDVVAAMEALDAAINYQETIQGWSKNAEGAWQYGEGGEYFQDGWKKIGATWYYFEDGTAVQSDWRKIDGEWYYLNSNCGAAYGWCKVDGDWYYFNGDNTMKTGWLKKEGAWYYLAASGKMVTGKQVIDGVEYTFSTEANALGQML